MEEVLWRIYVKCYLQAALQHKKKHTHNDYWNSIIMRAIIFFKDKTSRKWSINIREFKHSLEDA